MAKPERAEPVPPLLFQREPYAIKIGVTGHRKLKSHDRIRRAVEGVLADLDDQLGTIPHRYIAVSPLAEGADRLVAACVLDWKGRRKNRHVSASQLQVTLPMQQDEYVQTFDAETRTEAEREFRTLLARAVAPPEVLSEAGSHEAAYEQIGRYVVRNCDILLAIWDGEPARGRGGTAEIVAFAKENDRATYVIDPSSGAVELKPTRAGFVQQLALLSEYNLEPRIETSVPIADEVKRRLGDLQREWEKAGLDPVALNPMADSILPHQIKASRLATKYQKLYFDSVITAYGLSAGAVFCAGLGAFLPARWWLFAVEFGLIGLAIVLVWPKRFERWQRKWIDYRYLTERLRASCFLYAAGLSEEVWEPLPDLELPSMPESWTDVVVRDTWGSLATVHEPLAPCATRAETEFRVGTFLRQAWIEKQSEYYDRAAQRNFRAKERFELLIKVSAVLTLVAAAGHIVLMRLLKVGEEDWVSHVLSVAAVTLPALASALAGISVFRNYSRNAERYESMSRHLHMISRRMTSEQVTGEPAQSEPGPLTPLQKLVREADRAMEHEHRGWRAVFGIRLPGPG